MICESGESFAKHKQVLYIQLACTPHRVQATGQMIDDEGKIAPDRAESCRDTLSLKTDEAFYRRQGLICTGRPCGYSSKGIMVRQDLAGKSSSQIKATWQGHYAVTVHVGGWAQRPGIGSLGSDL